MSTPPVTLLRRLDAVAETYTRALQTYINHPEARSSFEATLKTVTEHEIPAARFYDC